MPKGIQIGIASETKAFKQGIDSGVIAPLEDAQQSLKDLGRDRSLDKLEDGLQDAQKASKDLEKDTKKTADAIEQEYRKSYAKLKTESKEGYHAAGEAAANFKDEARQNFGETVASFDGSMDSIADMAQGTLGGLATSMAGPVGLAIGGVGLAAGAVLAQIGADSEASAERVSSSFDRMIEAGGKFIDAETKNQLVRDAIDEKWGDIKAIVDLTGLSAAEVAKGMALGGSDAAKVIDHLETIKKQNQDLTDLDALSHVFSPAILDHYIGQLGEVDKANEVAAKKYDAYAAATQTAADEQGRRLQGLADQIRGMPTTTTVKVIPDTSEFDAAIRKVQRGDYVVGISLAPRIGKKVD